MGSIAILRGSYLIIALYHLLTSLVFRGLKSSGFELNDIWEDLTKYSVPLMIQVAILFAALVENSAIYLWNLVIRNTRYACEAEGSAKGLLGSTAFSYVIVFMTILCLGYHGWKTAATLWELKLRIDYEEIREIEERIYESEMEARKKYLEELRQEQIYKKELLIHEKKQAWKKLLVQTPQIQRLSHVDNPVPIKTLPMSEYIIDQLCRQSYKVEYNGI